MKTIKLLSILIILLSFSKCASAKFQEKPPFKILSSTYYSLANNTETNIYIRYISKNNINFDSIYFKNKKSNLEIKTMRGNTYAFAIFQSITKRDFILDVNPTKEFNNTIPKTKNSPFELKENESIYIYGAFNNFELKDLNKLYYNPAIDLYEGVLLLKQGFYNYKYILKQGEEISKNSISGTHSTTENDYLILLYYRDIGSQYDALVGIGRTNSFELQN